ncbi:MAG: alpha/beta hydrolase [Propioniciclava sp.]
MNSPVLRVAEFAMRLVPVAARFIPAVKRPPGVRVQTVALPGGKSRVLTPPVSSGQMPALLWIHGGGYILGAAAMDDARTGEIAARLGIMVVSVEYRLASRNPYPAPLDDCLAAWEWLVGNADELGVDTTRLAIGGASAGGGLAASLVQRLHDMGGVQPVAQWLWCPMLDARTADDRTLDDEDHVVWNNKDNRFGWGAYLAAGGGEYAVPAAREDLEGLPPAWISSGTIELFYPEDIAYAERLREAGVSTTVVEVPGAPHAVQMVARGTPTVKAYEARAREWLAGRLGTHDTELVNR